MSEFLESNFKEEKDKNERKFQSFSIFSSQNKPELNKEKFINDFDYELLKK